MSWWETLRGAAWLYSVSLFALGAIAGSFASAAIHRLPDPRLSLLRPARSFCPRCGAQLRWFENLPLASFLWQRGRCRHCGGRIALAYLANELLLALAFLAAGHGWAAEQGPLALLLLCIALTALWILAAIDWRHFILPDSLTLGGLPFGLLASLLVPRFQQWSPERLPWGTAWLGLEEHHPAALIAGASALIGALLSCFFLLGIRGLFTYLLRQEALGLGDVKYMAAAGALVGLEGAVWTFCIGVLAGALLGVVNVAFEIARVQRRRRARGHRGFLRSLLLGWRRGRLIPLGPCLVIGTAAVLLAPLATRSFFLTTWPAWMRLWLS